MDAMRPRIRRCLQRAAAIALALLVAAPELAIAIEPPAATRTKSLDSMSPSELEAFVASINHTANWRKFRRPSDPPDFEPGKPVRVMHGAGASLGRGGRGGGRSFRQSGLAGRRGGAIGGNRRSGDRQDQSAMERSRGSSSRSSSGSSFGSSSGRSSFGSSSRSSFGSGSGLGQSNGMN
jgi:hypothetical protein